MIILACDLLINLVMVISSLTLPCNVCLDHLERAALQKGKAQEFKKDTWLHL